MAVDCFLSPRKLRTILKCLCFGAVFLWILLGNYADNHDNQPSDHSSRRPLAHYRKLLAVSSNDTEVYHLGSKSGSYLGYSKTNYSNADECSDVHKLGKNVSKCKFIKSVDSCQNDGGLLNYLEFIYCTMPYRLVPLTMILLFAWLIFLFIFLGATAEEYFCPALTVMSQVLHLNQNVAGVTLLALGNGAPDIFSAYAAINQRDNNKASLAIGALFGAGMFVTTIVVGAVALNRPFSLTQRPFLRDIIFYMGAVFWTFYLLWVGSINIGNAVGFVALYVFYVVVVIFGRVIRQHWKKVWRNGRMGAGDIPQPPASPVGKELQVSDPESTTDEPTNEEQASQGLNLELPIQIEPDQIEPEEGARHILSVGSGSKSSTNGEPGTTVIQVIAEDEARTAGAPRYWQHYFANSSVPVPIPVGLTPPNQRRAISVDPQADPRANHSESPVLHKPLRKTISGALDITEEVGAAVGIPHVGQIWQEVHRSHNRSRTPIIEEPEESHTEPEPSSEPEEKTPLLMKVKKPKKPHPFTKMLRDILPFGPSFRQLGLIGKIYEVTKSPISIILALTVPKIDNDEENNNWNKWLNILHCVVSPVFLVLITEIGLKLIGGVFPVWTLVLIVGTFFAILVGCTSTNDRPPVYHCVFGWIGFAVSVVWIYAIANEIVNLLQAFGVVIKLSDGILGLTLLAWGNSIGDAVSNVTMARQGFPRMAIGACFGGPLLNILLGIGIASVVKSVRRRNSGFHFPLYFTQVEFLAALFLLASLVCSLVVIAIMKFRLKRAYGVFLIFFYVAFMVLSILAEFNVFTITIKGVIDSN